MVIQRMIDTGSIRTMGVVLMLAFASTGLFETASAQGSAESRNKSMRDLRQDVENAEEKFYNAFNAVNNEPLFNVHCESKASLGSRRKVFACKPRFLRDYEADVASRNNDTFNGFGGRPLPPVDVINKKQEQFQKILSTAVSEYPDVLKALNEFANAKRILESERQRR
jgi:hypothetical protein